MLAQQQLMAQLEQRAGGAPAWWSDGWDGYPAARRRLLGGIALAAIGPITAATIAEYGLEALISPREYTIPALAAAIAAHFRPGIAP